MKEGAKKYLAIQNEVIAKYNVTIVQNSTCWYRTHAHVKERKVCKWKQANSIASTFTLFHEIGHIETTKLKMRRCESEYYATVWAMDRCKEYGIVVPDHIIQEYQDYIDRERDRGVRRGGQNLPRFQLVNVDDVDCQDISHGSDATSLTVKQEATFKEVAKWRVGFKNNGQWDYQIFSDHQMMLETLRACTLLYDKISISVVHNKFTL